MSNIFTSESVSEGHPDKVCDAISDAILDTFLLHDPHSHVAVETLATTNKVVLAGEVRGPESVTPQIIENVVRETIRSIGYEQDGFHWKYCDIENMLHAQSPEIASGVDASEGKEEGAGDQGIMFGYACDETHAYMPATVYYASRILENLAHARHSGQIKGIEPDSKGQVTVLYENGVPIKTTALVLSTQHTKDLSQGDIRDIVLPIMRDTLPKGWMCDDEHLYINPTGSFTVGGPDGDSGLTGRKIIIDTYGGAAPHGGGAFSGKDPTKVDRSAAYMARYLAKNIVASDLAKRCTIQIAYAIGVSYPISFFLNTHRTGNVDEIKLTKMLQEMVDLSPKGIRTHLSLNKPIYLKTSNYGHFGRNPTDEGHFSWEKLDLVDSLKSEFGV